MCIPQISYPNMSYYLVVMIISNVVGIILAAFSGRLPTKDNFFHRGVIDHNSSVCMAGCDSVESSAHLFLHCNFFRFVWHFIYRWLGVSAVVPLYLQDHFNQSSYSGGTAKVCGQSYRLFGLL